MRQKPPRMQGARKPLSTPPLERDGARMARARERESEIGTLKAIGPADHPPESKYERLIARAKTVAPAQTIVVHPCDDSSLRGAVEAAELGIIKPTLVGPAAKISTVAQEHKLQISAFQVIDAPHSDAAAERAV